MMILASEKEMIDYYTNLKPSGHNTTKSRQLTNGEKLTGGETNVKNLSNGTRRFANFTYIPPQLETDWEQKPMNDAKFYNTSPVAKLNTENGAFNSKAFQSRTFNRRLKMRDTFTKVFPGYRHAEKTCFSQPASHDLHPKYKLKIPDTTYNHKVDPIKDYSESMYKLGVFAP